MVVLLAVAAGDMHAHAFNGNHRNAATVPCSDAEHLFAATVSHVLGSIHMIQWDGLAFRVGGGVGYGP